MGPSAYIVQDGVHVLLVSRREQPFGIAFSLTMDLDPRQMRYIGIKSSAHFRAGFEHFAGNIYVVSEPAVHSAATLEGQFKNLGRKLYPEYDL
jgi:microcystin degradation protein MlrC